jgi:hypothetical protein
MGTEQLPGIMPNLRCKNQTFNKLILFFEVIIMNENENKTITTTLRIQGDGRIQIPSDIRKELKLNPLDLVELKIRKI